MTRFLCARTTVPCIDCNFDCKRAHRRAILRKQKIKLRCAEGIRSIFRRLPFLMGCS
jgi:hypothetical protein